MPDLRSPDEAALLSAAQAAWASLAGDTMDDVLSLLGDTPDFLALQLAQMRLDDAGNRLADLLAEADLAGALLGQGRVARRLPVVPRTATGDVPTRPGAAAQHELTLASLPEEWRADYLAALPPAVAATLPAPAIEELVPDVPGVLLPLAEKAAQVLGEKRLLRFDQVKQLSAEARGRALAVAGLQRDEAKGRLQELFVEAVSEGPDLRSWQRRVREELPEGTFLSPTHAETAFRDAVQVGYAEGAERLLDDPIVGEHFPYVETQPIRDSRLSEMCALAAHSGIQHTAVYRRDDPAWAETKNPRHPRCRCGTNYLSVRDAARRGIKEAEKWLATGEPPLAPAWVTLPPELVRA